MYLLWYFAPLTILLVQTGAQIQRKDVDSLSDLELLNLKRALRDVTEDTTSKGYAAIAAYHGYPAQCRENGQDVACCRHGSAVFPQWHKLFVVQMEQALREKGLTIGVPYWDWTKPITKLPELFAERTFTDAGEAKLNPWHQGKINLEPVVKQTSRDLDERLFEKDLSKDTRSKLFEQVLNALEYPNYCQFEVQFEIAHNAIHYLVGGKQLYSMSLLEFAAYDPIFFSYHSNVDRIYAVYEALYGPEGRAPGYECEQNCEVCDVKGFQENLEPFNRATNPFPITREHSTALSASNRTVFGYEYDSLSLGGLNVDNIKQVLKERRSKDRAFASFRLYGIKMSANIKVMVCSPSTVQRQGRTCEFAGEFFILGGSIEMSWAFTRPYFHEITDTVLKMGLRLTDNYHVYAEVYNIFGIRIPDDVLPAPSVAYRPGDDRPDAPTARKPDENTQGRGLATFRKDIDRLTDEEVDRLRKAMETVQQKPRPYSYQDIAEMHGDPAKCPNPKANERYSCCVHGMPNFPHWHRLYVIQLEDALRIEGQSIGVPYWDWTKPGTLIPEVARNKTYFDPKTSTARSNPFFDAEIQFLNMSMRSSRDVLEDLTQVPQLTGNTELMDAVLLALEQDNFCDFEIQFEVAHNLIHGLVGGNSSYSMSTLAYSAFDPIFFLHHSFVDKIWSVWTSLQQLRGKPYKAHCAQSYIYDPLKPFAFSPPYNPNERTSAASVPTNIYDHEVNLGYKYDTLDFAGMSLEELEIYLNKNLIGKPRVFVGILLLGIRKSAVANIYITKPGSEKKKAGRLMLLGGPAEMPWRFDRLYRLDITKTINELGLKWDDSYDVTMEMNEFDGTPVDISVFPKLEVIYKAPGRESSRANA
ncbi:unnamed protein product [Lymnaea stagnalis]|uniref:Tyrosinase copper-binding domain-containing protein n=1 Tax=Lymnaea stagnalis TaxID=6523 RepID=A0AAV2I325_LYMST